MTHKTKHKIPLLVPWPTNGWAEVMAKLPRKRREPKRATKRAAQRGRP